MKNQLQKERKKEYDIERKNTMLHANNDCFGLVGFYGISTVVVYVMLNPLYSYIKCIRFVIKYVVGDISKQVICLRTVK